MAKRIPFTGLVLPLLALAFASTTAAEPVAYTGKLHIGFGDQDNTAPGLIGRINYAVPICAANPEVFPATTFPAGTTLGTLLVNGRANQVGSGPGAALTFQAVGPTSGGAQEKQRSTCAVIMPDFENPRLRSRTQVGSAHWPARKGPFTSMIASAPVPATPTATYRVSAGGGNDFPGMTLTTTLPFFAPGSGLERIKKGAANFGGAIPYSGDGGDQIGVQFFNDLSPLPTEYGETPYANGFLPFGPFHIGTDARGVSILSPVDPASLALPTTYPNGLLMGRHNATFAVRTPGGTTRYDQGAIRTVGGGNTVTPSGVHMSMGGVTFDCVAGVPAPCPKVTEPVAFSAVAFEWTTGTVTHTDMIFDFTTIRSAMGFDVAVAPSTAVAGETRRLQLVSPWAASIRTVGPFGLSAILYDQGFGGVAVLSIDIIPVPEPETHVMLAAGLIALVGIAARARNTRS